MAIIKAQIFNRFPEIAFGFSTRIGGDCEAPYFFNMSKSVGDDEKTVEKNRELFFNKLGLNPGSVTLQKQNHTDIITYVNKAGTIGESDAMFTDKAGLGLAASSADCALIFIYDPERRVIAAVHSGWRGTEQRIVEKTIKTLKEQCKSSAKNLAAYIAPSISFENYEVGSEFSEKFDRKYLHPFGGKYLLDVAGANFDMLIAEGLQEENIQKSELCSYALKNLLHSYRREGAKSGRALGIIAIKGKNE